MSHSLVVPRMVELRQAPRGTPGGDLIDGSGSAAILLRPVGPDADIDLDLHTVEQAYSLARTERSNRAPAENFTSLPLLQSASAC